MLRREGGGALTNSRAFQPGLQNGCALGWGGGGAGKDMPEQSLTPIHSQITVPSCILLAQRLHAEPVQCHFHSICHLIKNSQVSQEITPSQETRKIGNETGDYYTRFF